MKDTFVIKRSKWLRGDNIGDSESMLLRPGDNLMCCLGQVANQCGVPKKGLRLLSKPSQIKTDKNLSFLFEGSTNTALTENAVAINDDERISDKMRERKLIALFKRHNITLVFED